VSKKCAAFLQFCFPSMTFLSTLQFLICCRTGFEVLTVAVIHSTFWVRTAYGPAQSYECSGGPFWFCVPRPLEDTDSMPSSKPQYPQISLHWPVIISTKHLNLNILLFHALYPRILRSMYVLGKKVCHVIVHYISM
jgi:hypothetical protein